MDRPEDHFSNEELGKFPIGYEDDDDASRLAHILDPEAEEDESEDDVPGSDDEDDDEDSI